MLNHLLLCYVYQGFLSHLTCIHLREILHWLKKYVCMYVYVKYMLNIFTYIHYVIHIYTRIYIHVIYKHICINMIYIYIYTHTTHTHTHERGIFEKGNSQKFYYLITLHICIDRQTDIDR